MTDQILTKVEIEEQEGDIDTPLIVDEDLTDMESAVELAELVEPMAETMSNGLVQQLYHLINQVRRQHGKRDLRPNGQLQRAAQYHSEYMANHNCFSHQCSGEAHFKSRIAATGYRPGRCAENIGAGYKSAQRAVDRWMKSPGHRKNLLGDYKEMGCGYAYRGGTRYKSYWTFNAASPR